MFSNLSNVFALLMSAVATVEACDFHHVARSVPVDVLAGPHVRRSMKEISLERRAGQEARDWEYEDSADWGDIKPAYSACKSGKQQSPINIPSSYGLATAHKPTFVNYDRTVYGDFFNWGFGPSYTLYQTGGITALPQMKFDNKTVYLSGWHMHFPSEHQFDGKRRKGELHLVHVDAAGKAAAVIGILVDVGHQSQFTDVPDFPDPDDTEVYPNVGINVYGAIREIHDLAHYVTYQGSLTTPACTEGIRWFVSKEVLRVSEDQMEALLDSNGGRYSARMNQQIKDQHVNQ